VRLECGSTVTDEIYEHIILTGTRHISMASLDGMRDRAITINGMSKDLQRDRMACRMGHRPAGCVRVDTQSARFPDVGAAAPLQQPARSRSNCRKAIIRNSRKATCEARTACSAS